ncbi:bacterioferritin [Pandoraea thiooxydans]|uniref:Bacterioferritin n=2 Tax=Pandoraea thiooxydans TaxID=445709 RepID=A0A0G3EVT7_9BURK|nr:ferritin-like domain-containing protein [Pandoraea thiooxydans]AKJ70129.1 bacterioferritin [Pandoraea thiooxydans]APR93562.1 bacterioferritin [Pandoraea thiooxydans]
MTDQDKHSRHQGGFQMDIQAVRAKAREHLQAGAVTEGYGAQRDAVVKLLNDALATELVCVLRYKRHQFMASGIHAEPVAAEFAAHAAQELQHAERVAQRIIQLGGEPDFSPATLEQRSHAEYVAGKTLRDMIQENLVAERIAIDSYRAMAIYVGERDSTTRRLLEEILAMEEEHAHDMADLLERE